MRKRLLALPIAMFSMLLSSCTMTRGVITGYKLDEENNILAIYENGSTEIVCNLFDDDILNQLDNITISYDGYFVINNCKTTIKVTFSSIKISYDGFYIIDGFKTSIRVDHNSITISSDGYYVIDGVKTTIKVVYESVTISADGYFVINGIKTDIKMTYESVTISPDGYILAMTWDV